MRFEHNENRLLLTIDDEEQAELQAMFDEDPDYFTTDEAMWDFFEPLTCNSALTWLRPDDCGDITDAPMLGFVDYENIQNHNVGGLGAIDLGCREYAPILARWAYMDYQIKSPLEDLLATKQALFTA